MLESYFFFVVSLSVCSHERRAALEWNRIPSCLRVFLPDGGTIFRNTETVYSDILAGDNHSKIVIRFNHLHPIL